MPPKPIPLVQLTRLLSPLSQFHHHHNRLFPRVRSISTTPAPQVKARVLPHKNTFINQIRFNQADIPDLPFWLTHAVPPLVPDNEVSPVQCLEACKRYVALATENAPGWQKRHLSATATSPAITQDGKIPLFTLHYAAAILMLFAHTPGSHFLVVHILTTGTTLGYVPAVLDLARLGQRSGNLNMPQFEHAKEGLARLVADPVRSREYRLDTLTLAALAQISINTRASTDRAVQLLEEAFKMYEAAAVAAAGGEKKKKQQQQSGVVFWQWRTSAVLALSKIYVQRKQVQLARQLLSSTAEELDNPELHFLHATLLEPSDPQRSYLLRKAAVSGVEEAAREVARETAESLKEEGLSGWERKARQVIADEWAGIAGDKAIL
ncbi:hypothetical protein Daesc_005493 [Daldinia eschscholtzii]|uniref:Uncharacterized protein n=1 Tax=Daldinia eschscholtzii TaxID=292717 RepID=A0AAX6ML70_9PEZI